MLVKGAGAAGPSGSWSFPKCTGKAPAVCKQLCFTFSETPLPLCERELEGHTRKWGAWRCDYYRLCGKSGQGVPNPGTGIFP